MYNWSALKYRTVVKFIAQSFFMKHPQKYINNAQIILFLQLLPLPMLHWLLFMSHWPSIKSCQSLLKKVRCCNHMCFLFSNEVIHEMKSISTLCKEQLDLYRKLCDVHVTWVTHPAIMTTNVYCMQALL